VKKTLLFLILLLQISFGKSTSFNDSTSHPINKKRLAYLLVGVNTVYVGSMVALSEIWYKDYPKSSFHFFNDNHEWLQLDKVGHFTTAFHESVFGVKALRWAGVPNKQAILFGSLAGFIYQTPIEYFDGRSAEYGASVGDLTANTTGSALVLGQFLLWNEIRFQPKWSFHRTSYAPINPNLLGHGLQEEWIKDYNGQTYWMSFKVCSFIKNKDTKIPKWLNVSVGYGIQNMINADPKKSASRGYTPYRQYYLSLDFDFSKIKFRRKWMNVILYPLNFIHVPFPALEYSKHKFTFHPWYF
jgi:hypothetical protein